MYGIPLENITTSTDKYGFVNEYEVRASTGVSLVMGIYSFISIVFFGAFDLPMIFMALIWIDFVLKVFISPEYSLFGSIVRPFIGSYQWIGSVQKRFAWSIGLFLSTFAFLCTLIISGFLPSLGFATDVYAMVQTIPVVAPMAVPFTPPLLACLLCIIFMTLESVFGYCVGCRIYAALVRWGIMKKIPNQTCVNGVCEIQR